jgi:hypothetical protein
VPHYSFATLDDARKALYGRLYQSFTDTSQQQWTPAELQAYLTEALRVWNALTSFWRGSFSLSLQQQINWYDITDTAVAPTAIRPFTVTDYSLIDLVLYHLLEPQSAPTSTWAGSSQFAWSDILGALTRRQNETLGITGCTITQQFVGAPQTRSGIVLSDRTIDIRRVAWIPEAGNGFDTQIMRQTDVWAKMAFDRMYTTSAPKPPATWMQSTEPPPQFDVDYVPPVPGNYDVLTVNSGPVSNSVAAQTMKVPDDWSWVVKYGLMSDVFGRESIAKDPLRADYCQKRYQQGLQVMMQSPAVLSLQFLGYPMAIDAVKNGDNFNTSWQSLTQGVPNACYYAGLNLLGFPTPDAGSYGAAITAVENAPVPTLAGDFIQVDRSNYDVILDYSQHLAALKLAGQEFASTFPLYQGFLDRAAIYNSKLASMPQFQRPLYRLSQREQERNPRVEVG